MTKAAQQTALKALQDVVDEIDGEITAVQETAAATVRDLRKRRRELERAMATLSPDEETPAPTRAPEPAETATSARPSSRVIAGGLAIDKVQAYITERGEAFQADVTRGTGLNSGTVTHALRALAREGVVEATGIKSPQRSPQFRIIEAPKGKGARARESVTA